MPVEKRVEVEVEKIIYVDRPVSSLLLPGAITLLLPGAITGSVISKREAAHPLPKARAPLRCPLIVCSVAGCQ